MNVRRVRLATVLTAAAIILAACGGNSATPTATATPTPTVTPEPTVASGGSIGGERGRVELAADGFAITLADGWVSLPSDEDELIEVLGNIPDDVLSAQLKAQVPSIIASGMKLWAIDEATSGGASVNVLVIDQPLDLGTGMLTSLAGQGLTMIGAETRSIEDVDVDGTDGVKALYALTSSSGGRTVSVSGTQIYVQNAGRLYIMSFSDSVGNAGDDIAAMIETIELLP